MAVAARKPRFDIFLWEGTDRQGHKSRGEMEAASIAFVKAQLRRQGIHATRVDRRKKPLFSLPQSVTPKDIAMFTRQLATMVASGIPLAQGLEITAKGHSNPSARTMLDAIRKDVESGTSLTQALGRYPAHFDALYCNLVGAGEHAGILDSILDRLATYKEKMESIKGKIRAAMFYPAAVVVVAFIITAVLLIFVIPQFESLFQGFGADLPAMTQAVISLSRAFQAYWWLILSVLAGGTFFLVSTYKRSEKMQYLVDRLLLRAPVIGEIIRKATVARFARTLSTMFAAGVPLVEALESVAGATGNRLYHDATLRIRADVSTGRRLQEAMAETGMFNNMVVQMVAIGEEAGELDKMLSKVADFFEQEVDDAVAGLSSLLEPIIMVVLGVLIGGLVVAMYLPIFKIAAAI